MKVFKPGSKEHTAAVMKVEVQAALNKKIDKITKRLDYLVFEAGKNDLFYKDVDQSTLKITYEDKKAAIKKERNELIEELNTLI